MKFKVSDKVKVIKKGSHGFKVGTLITIIDIIPKAPTHNYRAMGSDGERWYMAEHEIE